MKKCAVSFVVTLCAAAFAQDAAAPVQLTPVPPKPTCHWIFSSGPCNDLWKAYNQARQQRAVEELNLYVSKQKELASSQATAPLQQQIDSLTKLSTDQQEQIKTLQEQMQSDTTAAAEAKDAAYKTGLEKGGIIGVGGMLLLACLAFGIRKLTAHGSSSKPLSRAASA